MATWRQVPKASGKGGIAGVRDRGLLESAVEQPRATAFRELLHADLFEMAAAYLFHIVKNHAFLDGNKRTALVAALVFLDINGVSLERDDERLYELTMAAAGGRADKQQIADQLRKLVGEAQA